MISKFSPVRGSDQGRPKWPKKKKKEKYAFLDPVPDLDPDLKKNGRQNSKSQNQKMKMTTFQPIRYCF
jgi:hypothetical protein